MVDMTYSEMEMAAVAEFAATPTPGHVTMRMVAGLQQGLLRSATLKGKPLQLASTLL